MYLSRAQKLAEPLYQNYAAARLACPLLKRNRLLEYNGCDDVWATLALVRHDAPAAQTAPDLYPFTPRVLAVACRHEARDMRESRREYGVVAVLLGITGLAMIPLVLPLAGVLLGLGGAALAMSLYKSAKARRHSSHATQLLQQQAKLQPALNAWKERRQDMEYELYLQQGPSPLTRFTSPESDKREEMYRLQRWEKEVARANAARDANGGVTPPGIGRRFPEW